MANDTLDFAALVARIAKREALGTKEQLAELLGIGVRSFQRYEKGQEEVPPYTRRLAIMIARHGVPNRAKGW